MGIMDCNACFCEDTGYVCNKCGAMSRFTFNNPYCGFGKYTTDHGEGGLGRCVPQLRRRIVRSDDSRCRTWVKYADTLKCIYISYNQSKATITVLIEIKIHDYSCNFTYSHVLEQNTYPPR